MSSTGNFRGQRTQSSTGGYKTLGSSIASGNNGGAFKRIFINALGNSNGNYDLALTKTLGIPRHYYNSTSNSLNYQQPSLSGKRVPVTTSPTAETLIQVFQSATVASNNGTCQDIGCPCSQSEPCPPGCTCNIPSGQCLDPESEWDCIIS